MFSFKRFSEQFKIILMQNAQKQGMFLAVLSLVFIYSHFVMFQKGGGSLPLDFMFWGFVITIFTIVNSTNVFSALLRTDSGIHYYMTPASIGEKFAAAWLYSSIFTIAVYSLVIGLVHLASMTVGNAITGLNLPYNFPGRDVMKEGFFHLMSIQSIFFLGAVVFRKNPFGKTLLSIICFGFIAGIIGAAAINWYLHGADAMDASNFTSFNWSINTNNIEDLNLPGNLENLGQILKVIGNSIPFICWIAAYFRLKTREV